MIWQETCERCGRRRRDMQMDHNLMLYREDGMPDRAVNICPRCWQKAQGVIRAFLMDCPEEDRLDLCGICCKQVSGVERFWHGFDGGTARYAQAGHAPTVDVCPTCAEKVREALLRVGVQEAS